MESVVQESLPAPQEQKSAKKSETYQDRVTKMSNRQIAGELRRKANKPSHPLMDQLFATVLSVIFDNYQQAKSMYPGA